MVAQEAPYQVSFRHQAEVKAYLMTVSPRCQPTPDLKSFLVA